MRRHRDGRAYVHVSAATANLIAGEVDLNEWDDEELLRGYSRAEDGSFRGRPPSVVPIGVYQKFVRRQLERAEQKFVENVAAATEALADIATDPDVEPDTRLKAIGMIHDRIWGKAKERVELGGALEVEPAWRRVIEAVTVNRELPPLEDDGVVDAEVLDDEEDEEYVFDE